MFPKLVLPPNDKQSIVQYLHRKYTGFRFFSDAQSYVNNANSWFLVLIYYADNSTRESYLAQTFLSVRTPDTAEIVRNPASYID